MKTHYDLIVIGAGPAGTPAAMNAARFGKKVLLVDKKDAPGGECLFEGCIPSKVLENAANHYDEVRKAGIFHIDGNMHAQIHWEKVLEDKDTILKKRSQAALKAIEQLPTLDFKQGDTRFKDTHTLRVGEELFSFDNALIATGAKTAYPPIEGDAVHKVWTNADVFKQKELPKELLFIGAGAISSELAQMFNKLGVKCHILQRSGRILKHLSEDAALAVQESMIQSGITIECGVTLKRIDEKEGRFVVSYEKEQQEHTLVYENVLLATGRVANLDALDLENAKVEYDHKGVIVSNTLQTSQKHIYACGDCIDAPKFAHTATYEAGVVTHNLFAPSPRYVDFEKNSWVLFSDPQVGVAGIDEKTAKAKELEIEVEKYDFSQDARAQIDKHASGYLKFIIDAKTQVIVGVEIVSEDASSLIGEASLIVANEMTAMDILKAIHPHPTLTESFGKLAQQVFFKSMMKRKKERK